MKIRVGRMLVTFSLNRDERLTETESGTWFAEYQMRNHVGPGQYETYWAPLGTYETKEDAAKALYVERAEFSASYGCDASSDID